MSKSFKERVVNFWDAFSEEEVEVRSMMDNKADANSLLEFVNGILSIAFDEIYFEMGINKEDKYELILTPEGDRAKLLQINYWLKMAPQQLSEKWNFYSSKPGIGEADFGLEMYNISINKDDVLIGYKADTERHKIDIEVYAPKLMSLEENQRYSMFFILLDQFIGELNTMEYIGYIDFVESQPQGAAVTIEKFKGVVQNTVKEQKWIVIEDPLDLYTGYSLEPNRNEDWRLREDVYVGSTACRPILVAFLNQDRNVFETFEKNGLVFGFVFYESDNIPAEDVISFRDEIENKILALAQNQKIADTIGGATGFHFSYMDFIIYDKEAFLKIAKDVLSTYKMEETGFCNLVYGEEPILFN